MHQRLAAMMLAASESAGGGGGAGCGVVLATVWDDNFDCGTSLDTAGTRFSGVKAWSLLNPGTTTYALSGDNLVVTPQTGAQTYRAAEMATLPAGDWTFETKVISTVSSDLFAGAFLILHESATGKMLHHGIGNDFGFKYQVRRFSDLSTWVGSYGGASATLGVPVWLEVSRSGSNLTFRYSLDGVSWTTVTTVAQTTDFTTAPDSVGIAVWRGGATEDEVGTFDYFHKTA